MLIANTPQGKLKFKNTWGELSAKDIVWYEDHVPAMMEAAVEVIDEGFDKRTVVKNKEAYDTLNFALLTLCSINKRKLLRAPYAVVYELTEKGITSFLAESPIYDDKMQKMLTAMKVGQFAIADMICRQYKVSKSDDDLNLFAAAMVTPFKKELVEERAAKAAKGKKEDKRHLMFRFQLYLNGIAAQSPLAFESDAAGGTGEPMDWRESMLQMAKDGPFGNFENIENNVRFVDYAAEMHRVKKEYLAHKKALKQK
jgi:hypothetical protein